MPIRYIEQGASDTASLQSSSYSLGGLEILIPICDLGGYGDLIAGANIYAYFTQHGIPLRIAFSNGGTKEKFLRVTDQSTDTLREYVKAEGARFICVCPVSDRRNDAQKSRTVDTITVEEYDRSCRDVSVSEYGRRELEIRTGFGFNPTLQDVQTGLYQCPDLDYLLETIDTGVQGNHGLRIIRGRIMNEILSTYSESAALVDFRSGLDSLLDLPWSFVYTSSVDNEWQFLDIVQAAEPHLKQPLVIYAVLSDEQSKEVASKVANSHWDYYDLSTATETEHRDLSRRPGVIIVNLGATTNQNFKRLIGVTDALSLVTGDQSLSQIIQKSGHLTCAPFFYHKPSWKNELAKNFGMYLARTSQRAADLFNGYISLTNKSWACKFFCDTAPTIEMLAKLLYDPTYIEEYCEALGNVREHFVADRRNAGIKDAETLWSVTDTLGAIVQGLLVGKSMQDAVSDLIPPATAKMNIEPQKGRSANNSIESSVPDQRDTATIPPHVQDKNSESHNIEKLPIYEDRGELIPSSVNPWKENPQGNIRYYPVSSDIIKNPPSSNSIYFSDRALNFMKDCMDTKYIE